MPDDGPGHTKETIRELAELRKELNSLRARVEKQEKLLRACAPKTHRRSTQFEAAPAFDEIEERAEDAA
jgi:hypothetical protein